jgi:hypothetical protein
MSMTEMTPFIRLAGAFLVRSMDPDYSDGVIGSLWMIRVRTVSPNIDINFSIFISSYHSSKIRMLMTSCSGPVC